jgi:hypothetical protein
MLTPRAEWVTSLICLDDVSDELGFELKLN